jgi:hypothetical protein
MLFLRVARGTFAAEVFAQFGGQVSFPVTFGIEGLRRDLVAIRKLALFGVAKVEPLLVVSVHVVFVPELLSTRTDEYLAVERHGLFARIGGIVAWHHGSESVATSP